MEDRNTKYLRELTVSKGNPLIQKSKYDLTAQQYDLLTFCISLVKPSDKQGTLYNFEITDFPYVSESLTMFFVSLIYSIS